MMRSAKGNLIRAILTFGLAAATAGCLGSAASGGSGSSGGSAGSGGSGGSAGSGGSGGSAGSGIVLGNMLCAATLALIGNYVQGNPPPADLGGGCWPDGTWTFTATVSDMGSCTKGPTLPSSFVFKVVQDTDFNDTVTYQNDPNNMFVSLKISGGDGAVCVGDFLIFSADGKSTLELRPALQLDNTLNGVGDYRLYDADQRN